MTPTEWLLSGDTGISSKTICMVMTGSLGARGDWWSWDTPADPDDFGRCYRLLSLFPAWRERLHEVARTFPKWGPMVAAWGELTAMYEQVCEQDGTYTRRSYEANKAAASAMYKRMAALNDEGRLADGWRKNGPGSWTKDRATEVVMAAPSTPANKEERK